MMKKFDNYFKIRFGYYFLIGICFEFGIETWAMWIYLPFIRITFRFYK